MSSGSSSPREGHSPTHEENLLLMNTQSAAVTAVTNESSSSQPSVHILPSNVTLERQITSRRETIFYVILFILLDLSKMMSSYALKYYNDDVYPVKQTLIVFSTELLKFFLILVQMINDGSLGKTKLTLLFALPSILYAINNNLFLYALNFTSPAVWSILTQSRVIITALVYRILFKRAVSGLQWCALFVLCLAIMITKLSGDDGGVFIQPMAFLLAGTVSLLSVAAAVVMEYLFKNNKRPFAEQQLQLYLYSSLICIIFFAIENYHTQEDKQPEFMSGNLLPCLLLSTVQLGAMSGLITATVIKKLDNIVKIYSQSLTGILNASISMILFPRTFSPDWKYAVSLLLVIAAIAVYEREHVKSTKAKPTDDKDTTSTVK